jgi:hypothetical protein
MLKTKILPETIFEADNTILNFISLIETEATIYKLGTDIEGLNIDAKFTKKDNGNFELSFSLQESDDFDIEYFFIKPALLVAKGMKILILNKDVIGFKQTLFYSPEKKCNVEVNAFRGDIDDSLWLHSKQGAYFKVNTSQFELHKSGITFDITTNKDQKSSFKNAVLLNIEESPILFYYERIDERHGYFIFQTQNVIDFDKFDKIVNATRVALGLISGYYMADSVYYISLKKGKGVEGLTYKYRNINETIKHNYPLIDKALYKDISESELKLNGSQFNELVKLLYRHEEYYRASLLLITAGSTKGISKGSLASVALETISGVVGKKLSSKKIITEKTAESQLLYELKKGLKKTKPNIAKEQYYIFETKISHINTIPNAQKLEDSFRLLEIDLDEEELYCLSCRNRLLHGALPKNKKLNMLTNDELIFLVSNRLIMLSTMLLLKMAGYKENVIDWGFTEISKRRAIIRGEKVQTGNAFRNISITPSYDDSE